MHESVLAAQTLDLLDPKAGESILDCTLGLGGHASLLLDASRPNGTLLGLDADGENLAAAERKLAPFGDRFEAIHMNFLHIADLADRRFDIIFADLGVSSPHFDDPTRGFSFRFDGPLDLRLNRRGGKTAAEWIEKATEDALADVLSLYGEIPPRALARELKKSMPQTTFELVSCVERVFGFKARALMAQVFQALRMRVNHELEALDALLEHAPAMLKPGGRLAIISFHSLEDRRVKQAFARLCESQLDPVTGQEVVSAPFVPRTKKPVMPSQQETDANPRSRSAKLRVVERLR